MIRWPLCAVAALALALTAPEAVAQAESSEVETAKPEPPLEDLLDAETLDELVAPVALYPDPLLAQVFVASTYPLDVVRADRWVEDNVDLEPGERADAAGAEDWDASVVALAAGFPDVVGRMAEELDWTETLGDALLAQPDDVLDAVQRQRARAAAVGNLESNPAQTVTVEGDDIAIAPADPEIVYLPAYDPQTAYVTSSAPPPTTYVTDGGSGYSGGEMLVTGAIAFGAGMLVNEVFSDDDDWNGYWGPRYPVFGWNDRAFYPRPGRGVYGNDIDIDVTRNRVDVARRRRDVDRDGRWRPDDDRRDDARRRLERRDGDRMASRGDGVRSERRQRLHLLGEFVVVDAVGLVEDGDDGRLVALVERVVARHELLANLVDGLAGVHDEQDEVGLVDGFERGLERLHEPVREVADEPDRVRQQDVPALQFHPAGRRSERREQLVLGLRDAVEVRVEVLVLVDVHVLGEPAQERRLPRVRVARERHQVEAGLPAGVPALGLRLLDLLQFVADAGDLGLDVLLAALVVLAEAHEPRPLVALRQTRLRFRARQLVAQLGELHLELCLPGLRALPEDVQNQPEAVDDLGAVRELLAEVVRLVRAEAVVEDHAVGVRAHHELRQLCDFPLAELERGVGGPGLGDLARDLEARGSHQLPDRKSVV